MTIHLLYINQHALKKKETLWHLDMMLEIFEDNGVTELYFNRNVDAPEPELK